MVSRIRVLGIAATVVDLAHGLARLRLRLVSFAIGLHAAMGPAGSRVGIGAILIGYYEDGRMRYAGKVGTGFDRRTLLALRQELDQLQSVDSPFEGQSAERTAHWVRPRLVAQIAFSEWTRDGMLRHLRYVGLRDDKDPTDVVRERGEP